MKKNIDPCHRYIEYILDPTEVYNYNALCPKPNVLTTYGKRIEEGISVKLVTSTFFGELASNNFEAAAKAANIQIS